MSTGEVERLVTVPVESVVNGVQGLETTAKGDLTPVLILSAPGLRAEALREKIPLEVVEMRALRDAAADLARNYGVNERKAADRIARILARYAD